MGCVVPTPEFLRALGTLTKAARRAVDLRRSDDRLSGGVRRSAIAVRHRAGSDDAGQDRRRRAAGGSVRRPRARSWTTCCRRARCFRRARSAVIHWPRRPASRRCACLRDAPPYERLERLAAQLADGLQAAANEAGVPHTLARVGSMLTLFFGPDAVIDWPSASRADTASYARYFWGLVERGVYMPCSQFEALFVSAAHSEADIAADGGGGPHVAGKSVKPADFQPLEPSRGDRLRPVCTSCKLPCS